MKNKDMIIKSAIAAFLAFATTSNAMAAKEVAMPDTEKCYGIAKVGTNDCATATQSCAGSATKDKQADAFLFVPKGLCEKISGGMLKPGSETKTSS